MTDKEFREALRKAGLEKPLLRFLKLRLPQREYESIRDGLLERENDGRFQCYYEGCIGWELEELD